MDSFSWINGLVTLIGGLGIGTLISSFWQESKNKKKFLFEQKLTTYSGYLESLANVITKDTIDNKQKVVYWTTRLKLIAPGCVHELAMEFFNEGANGKNFVILRDKLVNEMSKDLRDTI